MNSFLKSWKTSLLGLAAGALNLLANGHQWKQVLLSVGVALLGALAKDGDVTGGTVAATPEAAARVNADK